MLDTKGCTREDTNSLDKIKPLISDNGVLIIETDEKTLLPESINGLIKNDERKYGRS